MSICTTVTVFASEEKTEGQWIYADYTYNGTEGVEILGYSGNKTDVYIPAIIAEKPVLRVGDSAFKNMTGLNSVTFSTSIKELGNNAFEGATNLVCVLLNENLVSIGDDVFDGCHSPSSYPVLPLPCIYTAKAEWYILFSFCDLIIKCM